MWWGVGGVCVWWGVWWEVCGDVYGGVCGGVCGGKCGGKCGVVCVVCPLQYSSLVWLAQCVLSGTCIVRGGK